MRYTGPQVEVKGIISNLETVLVIATSFNVLMHLFYKIIQDQNEKIPAYTTRIEGVLNQIRFKYPHRLDSTAISESTFFPLT